MNRRYKFIDHGLGNLPFYNFFSRKYSNFITKCNNTYINTHASWAIRMKSIRINDCSDHVCKFISQTQILPLMSSYNLHVGRKLFNSWIAYK